MKPPPEQPAIPDSRSGKTVTIKENGPVEIEESKRRGITETLRKEESRVFYALLFPLYCPKIDLIRILVSKSDAR